MFVKLDGWWTQIGNTKIPIDKNKDKQSVSLNIDHILDIYEIPYGTIFELDNGDTLLVDVSFEEASDWDIWEIC